MGLFDLSYFDAALEEHRARHDEDTRVDEKGGVERDSGVNKIKTAGLFFGCHRCANPASLHQGRVQIQVVGHHGSPQNADGHIETFVSKSRD